MNGGQLKLFSGSAHPALAQEIADFLGVSMGHARLQRFPDTECSFQIDENIRGTDVFVIQPTCADVDRSGGLGPPPSVRPLAAWIYLQRPRAPDWLRTRRRLYHP